MASCTFKSEESYKKLEGQVGEDLAIRTWLAYAQSEKDLNILSVTELKKELGIYKLKNLSDEQIINLAKRVSRYNKRNGTSHHFVKESVSNGYSWDITKVQPSYLPVNLMRQYLREQRRSEVDKRFENFPFSDGVYETTPEEQVVVMPGNQYVAAGEVFPSYQDALDYLENEDHQEEIDAYNSSQRINIRSNLSVPLQEALDNLDVNDLFLGYFYEMSSKGMTRSSYNNEVVKLVNRLRGTVPNESIFDAIKCI